MLHNSPGSHLRRQLFALSIKPDPNGERLPVVGIFPSHTDNAAGIAALVEVASLEIGLSFKEYLKMIAAAAPPEGDFTIRARVKLGRPPNDWKGDYGKSASFLLFRATIRKALQPKLTWMAVLKSTLQATKRGYSDDKYVADAAKLKEAARSRSIK
jgi:hypothetical protein